MSDQSAPDAYPRIANGADWVIIAHPETGGVAEVHKDSVGNPDGDGYASRGWSVVKVYEDLSAQPAPAEPAPAPLPQPRGGTTPPVVDPQKEG